MSSRVTVLLPVALAATTWMASAWAHRMEHRISLKGRTLSEVATETKHKRFFPKDAAEVVQHLHAIAEGLKKWYGGVAAEVRQARRFRFPKSTRWSPVSARSGKAACAGGAPTHSPADAAWEHASWKALGFRPSNPHHFQYRVVAVGSGAEASFSVQARADRDCNGRMALYRLSGHARGGALRFPLLRVRHADE